MPRPRISLAASFLSKVGIPSSATACWPWLASTTKAGYGQVWDTGSGTNQLAHRVAYRMWRGPIPDGAVLDHEVCDNRACCNPWHVEPKTQRANILRSETSACAVNARKTHCPQGHPYSEENTMRTPAGHRQCRTCQRRHSAAAYARRKAA